MKTHIIHRHPSEIAAISEGNKSFVIVDGDAEFRVGDVLVFCCVGYPDRVEAKITCLTDRHAGLDLGWIVLGFKCSKQRIFKDLSAMF